MSDQAITQVEAQALRYELARVQAEARKVPEMAKQLAEMRTALTERLGALELAEDQRAMDADPEEMPDDPAAKAPPFSRGGDGVRTHDHGGVRQVGVDLPHWYRRDCGAGDSGSDSGSGSGSGDRSWNLIAPNVEIGPRPWGITIWKNGCFYNVYDKVTLRDGQVYRIELDCEDLIVCAVACTELTNPECV